MINLPNNEYKIVDNYVVTPITLGRVYFFYPHLRERLAQLKEDICKITKV